MAHFLCATALRTPRSHHDSIGGDKIMSLVRETGNEITGSLYIIPLIPQLIIGLLILGRDG